MSEVVKFIFLFLIGSTTINFLIAVAAAHRTQNKEFRQLVLYWICLFATYGAVAVLNENPTQIGLAFFVQFAPGFLKTKFLRDARGLKSNWPMFLAFQAVGMVVSTYMFYFTDYGFTYSLLPVVFTTSLPYWEPVWNSLVTHRHESNWIEKGLGLVLFTSVINHFNYAFFRLEESAAWWGWGISIAQYQCISVFLPLLINNRRELKERQNLEATLKKMSVPSPHNKLEIDELYRTLELHVGHKDELSRRLQDANNKLEEEQEMNEILIKTVSHDLANPLTVINAYVDMIGTGRTPESERPIVWGKIKSNTKSALDMIHRIRNAIVTRNQATLMAIHDVDIERSVNLLLEKFETRLKEKNITVDVKNDLPLDVFVASQENALVEHVFANVMSNSIKFSSENSKIEISIHGEKDSVIIKFRDFGIGINPERLEKRILHTTEGTCKEVGSGFGILVMGYFVRKFGGSYTIHSDGEGKGTTLTITLKTSKSHARQLYIEDKSPRHMV